METMRWGSTALMLLLVGGCGNSRDDLSMEVVTNLPDGDGTGSNASGSYIVDLKTVGCSGTCPTVAVFGFSFSICQEGKTFLSKGVTVDQNSGHLDVTVLSSALYVTELAGGIDQDGDYDVGGATTELSGAVQITARVTGTITTDHQITGTARAWGFGEADGTSINCIGTFSLTGSCSGQCGGNSGADAGRPDLGASDYRIPDVGSATDSGVDGPSVDACVDPPTCTSDSQCCPGNKCVGQPGNKACK